MGRIFIGLTVAAVSLVSLLPATNTAQADPYRWCAYYSGGFSGGGTNCGFVTLSQCRAAIHGAGGYCEPNPRYTGSTTGRARHTRSKERY
jgi:hypothetical protein